jgi:hypothetical protein
MIAQHFQILSLHNLDRRRDERYPGDGLLAEVEGVHYSVTDVSIGGLMVAGLALPANTQVTVRVFGAGMPAGGVSGDCLVCRSGDAGSALQFEIRTYPLLQAIIHHISRFVGHQPVVF